MTLLMDAKWRMVGACMAAFLIGTALASAKVASLPSERIEWETFVQISGAVERLEYRTERPTRVTISIASIDKQPWLEGRKIRLSVRTKLPDTLKAGDTIETRAVLDAQPGPIVPGGYDFARHARLQGIAAQGFAVSDLKLAAVQPAETTWRAWVENRRQAIANKVLNAIEAPFGGVAVALITGQRQYLEQETTAVIRDAGLAHLLAISGLHMGLITGVAFFLFEFLFAAVPAIASRLTPRKAAAIVAWSIALAYLILSGANTSTMRAFAMVSIAILAVLTDRRALSLRSVALAALVIIVLSPHAVLSSGFHMSFAATAGIIVFYDLLWLRKRSQKKRSTPHKWWQKLGLYFFAAGVTSLISQFAITPFALYHFQAVSIVGILTNIVAIPVMAFFVMPLALLSVLLMPLGLEAFFLTLMGEGLSIIVALSKTLTSIGGPTVWRAGPFSSSVLIWAAVAFLVMALWRSLVGLSLAFLLAAVGIAIGLEPAAHLLLANGGRVVALKANNGNMAIVGGRRGGFREQAWRRYWNLPIMERSANLERQCQARGCEINLRNLLNDNMGSEVRLVSSRHLGETRRACAVGAIVVAPYTHRRHCHGAAAFVSSEDIDRYGPVGVRLISTPSEPQVRLYWSITPRRQQSGNTDPK